MDYFGVLIGREDVQRPKPDAEPIIKALIKLKSNKENCFMIGDTCMDILAAKAAGVKGYGGKFRLCIRKRSKKNAASRRMIFDDVLSVVKNIIKSH